MLFGFVLVDIKASWNEVVCGGQRICFGVNLGQHMFHDEAFQVLVNSNLSCEDVLFGQKRKVTPLVTIANSKPKNTSIYFGDPYNL